MLPTLVLALSLAAQEVADFVSTGFESFELPRLEAADVDGWVSYLLPNAEEAGFESIPWRPTFAEGLRDAGEAGKPLLLWVMNGHPLGCT